MRRRSTHLFSQRSPGDVGQEEQDRVSWGDTANRRLRGERWFESLQMEKRVKLMIGSKKRPWRQRRRLLNCPSHDEHAPCCWDGSSSGGRYHTEGRKSHCSGRWGCLEAQRAHAQREAPNSATPPPVSSALNHGRQHSALLCCPQWAPALCQFVCG